MPAAWLGYSPEFKDGFCVRICAWCPDKPQADALAKAENLGISHSICPSCFQDQQEAQHP